MRGGVGVLEAAALVDGDVHQHAARLHLSHEVVRHQLGGRGAGDQHRADHQVGLGDRALDRQLRGRDAVHPVAVAPEAHAELLQVDVEQRDVGAHPHRDVRGVLAGGPGAQHGHLCARNATDAAHQHPTATAGLEQRGRAHLGSETAGDLAHGVQQRQGAVGALHRLVRDGGRPRINQCLRQLRLGGQVQIGEQHLVGAQAAVLLGDRLLDLDDHLGLAPDLVSGLHDAGALGGVLLVGDRRAHAGSGLHEHLVAAAGEFPDADGGHADPVLVVLDLSGDSDAHGLTLPVTCAIRGGGVRHATPSGTMA